MKIKEIKSQYRRDFTAMMVCEGCGHEQLNIYGYDDRHYHENVIPDMKCKSCGQSANDMGLDTRPLATKYPEGMQV